VRHAPIFVFALALAAGAGAQACSGGERAQGGPQAKAADGTAPPEGVTSTAAEQQIVTLTGCLKRDVQPGSYALVSVATAGVLNDKDAAQQRRGQGAKGQDDGSGSQANIDTATPGSMATLASGSSYSLIPAKADQRDELAKLEKTRVTVRGRLAADTPVGTSGNAGDPRQSGSASSGGTVVDSSATNATVAGAAPTLRGFHLQSVTKVADSCK
jgi:hypothetical protein